MNIEIILVVKYGTHYTWDFQTFLTSKYKCQILSYSNELLADRTEKINTNTHVC